MNFSPSSPALSHTVADAFSIIKGVQVFRPVFLDFVCVPLPIVFCLADFIRLFAHFVVSIRHLDELTKHAVVLLNAVGATGDLFK